MTPRYSGCYRGPGYTKVALLGGRLVLCVYRYRRTMRLKKGPAMTRQGLDKSRKEA